MLGNLNRFFSPPVFEDEDKTYRARILNIILLIMIPLSVIAAVNTLFFTNDRDLFFGILFASVFLLLAWTLLHFRYLILSSFLLPAALLMMMTFICYITYGIHSVELVGFALTMSLAGLLLGRRWPVIFAVAAFLSLGWVNYAEVNGIIVTPFSDLASYGEWLNAGFLLLVLGFVNQFTIGYLTDNLRRARLHEQALSQSNRELEAIQTSLTAQTSDLATVAALGERLNALLDLEVMLPELANRVKEYFGYLEARVYLMDQTAQVLVPQAGTTDQTEPIPLRSVESLIAQAARNRQVLISAKEPAAALKTEIAAPIMVEEQVLGILYGQAGPETGMGESTINIWRSLANQVAVAINNAQRFAETERALAEARALQERYVQQVWQAGGEREQECTYQRRGEPELPAPFRAQLKQLAQHQQQVAPVKPEEGADYSAVVAPIKLQDQVIGTMEFHELKPDRQWSEQELALVQVIADQVAQTAENLRLFEETQERAKREATIREITDKLRAAPNLDALLETAARELGQQLGVRHTVLELGINSKSFEPALSDSMPRSPKGQ